MPNLLHLLQSLEHFDGQVKSFTSSKEALNFLQLIRSPDGVTLSTADLIFMTYNVKVSQGLQLLEQIIDFYERRCDPQLTARVVVCSSFALQVFQDYVV